MPIIRLTNDMPRSPRCHLERFIDLPAQTHQRITSTHLKNARTHGIHFLLSQSSAINFNAVDFHLYRSTAFAAMARAHERWIEALFADLTTTEADDLTRLLERTKRSLHATTHEELNG